MSDDIVPGRPTAVKIGIVTATVLGILFLLAIPFSPLNVIPVLVFLAIALGLWRGSAWSGYGGALFIVARWVGELLALQRFSAPSVPWASWALATVLGVAVQRRARRDFQRCVHLRHHIPASHVDVHGALGAA